MAALTLNGAASHFTLGPLWSLCGETMHSANIALAVVALPLTTNLVILFSSLCHQKYCLFNLCLSRQVFLFSFLGFLFATLFLDIVNECGLRN